MIRTALTRTSLRRLAALVSLLSLLGIALLFSPGRTISGKGKSNSARSAAQRPQEPPLPPNMAALKGRRRTGQNSVPRPLAAGGPDAFGYTFITNQPPPPTIPNSFVDISTTGTPLGSGDDQSFTATLLQPFSFYGTSYSALQVSTNGYISTDLTDIGADFTNDCPLPATPEVGGGGRIYPLHGDLVVGEFPLDPTARILTQFYPVCPRANDVNGAAEACTVIMWDNATFFGSEGGAFDFEVILYHTTNEIVVQFRGDNPDNGANTTTGIQNPAATTGLTVACNMDGSIPDDFAVAFILPCTGITCPGNITVANTPGQCNAVVNYPAPTAGSSCGPVVCTTPSGSTFPVGTTTVTCRATNLPACNSAYGLTINNELVTFNVAAPGTLSAPVAIQGLSQAETVVGIDFRPSNGVLYGVAVVGSNARLLTINPTTGATAQVGASFTVTGTNFAVDFNPVPDLLRFVSNTDLNLRINPNTGAVMTDGTINPAERVIVGAGYTHNVAGATTTTLYTIDSNSDQLFIQNPPNAGTQVLVGALGVDTDGLVGFDISQCTGTAYATLTVGGTSNLYTINLATGTATLVGAVGGEQTLRGFALGLTAPANQATCSFTVTVQDTQAPTITCPANVTQANDPGQCNAVVNYPAPMVSDNCPGVGTPVCMPPSGSTFAVGTTTVNCTVADASANSPDASCSFTVTVRDTQAPTITCPTSFAVSADFLTGRTVTFPAPAVSDNCPGVGTPVCTPASGSNFPLGTTTVNCTVADASPNSPDASCSFTITVNLVTSTPVGPGSPFPPTSEVSDQKAGSVLVYNLYSSNAASPNTQNTRLAITNVNPTLDIAVHLFFVDGQTCSIADAIICLTKNQTASFLASDLDPGTTGYVVAVASDLTTGCPVNFNFLIGDAYVKLASGHQANLGAEAFSALTSGPVACDGNALTATLNFDGVSYNRAPRTLAASSIPARNDSNDTLLVINRFGGNLATGAATLTNLFGIFYNDAETGLSFSFNPGVCQFRSSLTNNFPRTTPRLDSFIPAGRSGWLRLYSTSDIGLLGAILNYNPNAQTNAGAFNQGRNLHKLTLTSTQTLIIPILPPNCQD